MLTILKYLRRLQQAGEAVGMVASIWSALSSWWNSDAPTGEANLAGIEEQAIAMVILRLPRGYDLALSMYSNGSISKGVMMKVALFARAMSDDIPVVPYAEEDLFTVEGEYPNDQMRYNIRALVAAEARRYDVSF